MKIIVKVITLTKSLIIALMFISLPSKAYKNEYGHDRLALYSYQLLKQCQGETAIKNITVNDVITIANGSAAVDEGKGSISIWERISNWHFYKRKNNTETGEMLLIESKKNGVNRTFKKSWDKLIADFISAENRNQKMHLLGEITHFIEDMSNPAHVVPAFHGAGVKDGIDDFLSNFYKTLPNDTLFVPLTVDSAHPCDIFHTRFGIFKQRYNSELERMQHPVLNEIAIFNTILNMAAEQALQELKSPILHCPKFSWANFYTMPDDDEFFGQFYRKKIKSLHRYQYKGARKVNLFKKVVIGYQGEIIHPEDETLSCSFTHSTYQPFVDRLFLNAILADAILLYSINNSLEANLS